MNILRSIVIFSMISYIMANHHHQKADPGIPFSAIAILKSVNGSIEGVVRFEQNDISSVASKQTANVKVSINITGLPQGPHGFHVHQFGDLSNGCTSAGPHYNPSAYTHGSPNDTVRHVGDLGNVVANGDRKVITLITDRELKLSGPFSIIGRAVVVHALRDDLGLGTGDKAAESKKTGNAGARVACGVIGLSST